MPESVEIPAPVRATTEPASAIHWRTDAMTASAGADSRDMGQFCHMTARGGAEGLGHDPLSGDGFGLVKAPRSRVGHAASDSFIGPLLRQLLRPVDCSMQATVVPRPGARLALSIDSSLCPRSPRAHDDDASAMRASARSTAAARFQEEGADATWHRVLPRPRAEP